MPSPAGYRRQFKVVNPHDNRLPRYNGDGQCNHELCEAVCMDYVNLFVDHQSVSKKLHRRSNGMATSRTYDGDNILAEVCQVILGWGGG